MATQPPTVVAGLSLSVTPGHFGLFDVLKKLLFRENLAICKGQKVDHDKSGLSGGSRRCTGIFGVPCMTTHQVLLVFFLTEPSISPCHQYHHLHHHVASVLSMFFLRILYPTIPTVCREWKGQHPSLLEHKKNLTYTRPVSLKACTKTAALPSK